MNVTFSSSGNNYTATDKDIFMDNSARIVFIRGGKQAGIERPTIQISPSEWRRIKPHLHAVDYEGYYGRKPLVGGVTIYKVKQ